MDEKDLLIFKLLIFWRVVYLKKKGQKVELKLRESEDASSRFIKIIFSKCTICEYYNFLEPDKKNDLTKVKGLFVIDSSFIEHIGIFEVQLANLQKKQTPSSFKFSFSEVKYKIMDK